ncbi:hypothetical protein [Niabella ginsengisoli]|uniref:NAD(+)--protein-arginine ADP-ribosyltransferase n=1 Tax=Niabella ginsengisoli TaxID=522298 RepID=A0ABS9SHX5_9BACT|nr:hypothetical protein [Niabella ginsengisoli]MCH5597974.1 hypothetical protein [Niabella ginsengisoli]
MVYRREFGRLQKCEWASETGGDGYEEYKIYQKVKWEDPVFLKPFDMVLLTDDSDFDLINGISDADKKVPVVPVILLYYAKEKGVEANLKQYLQNTLDVATLLVPVTKIATGPKWLAKTFTFVDKWSKVNAGANLAINNSPLQDIPELKTTLDAYNAVTAAMNITSLAGAIGKGTIAKFFKELDNPAAKKALLVQAKNGSDDAKKVLDVEAELKVYSETKLGKDWWKGVGSLAQYAQLRNFLGNGKLKAYLNNQELVDYENLLKTAHEDVLKIMDKFKNADEFAEMTRGYKDNPTAFTSAIKDVESFNGTHGWLKFWQLTPKMENSLNAISHLKMENKIANVGNATDIQLASIHAYTANGDFVNVPYRYNPTWFGKYNTRAVKHINEGLDELRKIPERVAKNEEVFSGKTFSKVNFESKFVGKNNTIHSYNGYMSTSKLESVAEGFIVETKKWATGGEEKIAVIQRVIPKNGVYIDDISDWGKNLGKINHPTSDIRIQVQEEVLLNSQKLKQVSEPIPAIENGVQKTIDGMKVYYVDFVEIL